MKKLIRKIFLFIAIISLVASVSYNVNLWSFKKAGLQLCDTTGILMTGSSLVMQGLNPAYIERSENVAIAAEPVVISFFKIRDILRNNPQIKKIITSCSLQEITEQDAVFSGKRSVVQEMFTRLSFLQHPVTLNDLRLFEVDEPVYWEVYLRYRIFPNYFYIYRALKGDIKCNYEGLAYVSGFATRGDFNIRAEVFKLINVERVVNAHFPENNKEKMISKVSLNYIDSISSLCERKNIELIVVGMPVTHKLFERIPRYYIDYYRNYISEMNKRIKCRYYDFMNAAPDEWFEDLIHLNELGAKNISIMLNDSIKNDK
jgi:hypothetical protein